MKPNSTLFAHSFNRVWSMTIPCLVLHLTLLGAPLLTTAEEPGEKAARYHSALLKRPSGGYLFDRFLNSWLDTGTIDGLDKFLEGKASAESATGADRLLYGFFLTRMGRDEDALAAFETALEAEPENAEAWAESAKVRATGFDFDQALKDLAKALEFTDDEDEIVDLTKRKGRWLSRSGKTDEAIATWNQLIADYPDDDELREDLVDLQLDENLTAEALATQKSLVETTRDPYHKITRNLRLGDIYLKADQAEEATNIYTASLDQAGRDTWLEKEIIAQIERLFRREDNLTGLKNHYIKILEDSPGRIALLRSLASVHAELDEKDEAIEVFQELLKMTPGDRANREEFVQLLGRLEQTGEAVKQMEALSEAFPDDPELKAQLAVWQHDAKQPDAARASVNAFLEQSDQSEYSYLRAARLLEQFSLTEAAAETYEKLIATFPASVGAVDERAAFLHRNDREEEAIQIWKDIAASGTSQDAIRAARMLASRGERESAYEILLTRAGEFTDDFVFLGRLCTEALASGHAEEVIPWVETRLALAESPSDFDDALRQARSVFNQAEVLDEKRESLSEKGEARTLAEACLFSELLDDNGEYEAATEILVPWIEQGELIAMNQRVRQLESRNEWAEAALAMEAIVKQPDGARSNYIERVIGLHQRALNPEKSLEWIEEWKKTSPGSSRPWLTQARILHDDNKTEDAIAVLRKTVGRFDDEESARVLLASLYGESGKTEDADRIYWNLYEESEDISSKLRWAGSLASSAESQGKVDRLLEQFEERKRANRTSIAPLLSIAEIHRRTDNYEERREALMEATRLRPEDLSLLHQIARIEESEGDWERAVKTLESALTLDKSDDTEKRIALLYLRYGDEEEGYRRFTELGGGDEMDAKTIIGLADAMIARNGWDRALELLDQHYERFPENYELQYLRAISLEESQKTDLAIEAFLSLLEQDTEHDPKKANLATMTTAQTQALNSYYSIFPEGTKDLASLQRARYEGFQYRQALRQQRVRFTTNPMTGASGLVRLPSSIDQLHDFATVHLHGLAQWIEEEDGANNLAREMKTRGVENADIILATVHSDQYSNESPVTAETLSKFPENEALHAYFVMMEAQRLSNRNAASDGEQLLASSKFLRKNYPETALAGAIAAASTWEEETFDLLGEMLETELEFENVPSGMLQSAGASLLLNFPSDLFPEETRDRLLTKLAEWKELTIAHQKKEAKNAQMVARTFFYPADSFAAILRNGDDLTAYAEYLDTQIARYEEFAQQDNNAAALATQSGLGMYLRYTTRNRPLISPLGFPPLETPMIPGSVLGQFVTAQGIYRPYEQTPFDPDKASSAAASAENKWLAAFFHAAAEEPEKVTEIVEAELAASAKSGQRLPLRTALLSAAWYQNQEDWEKAGEILESVRRTPMDRTLRQRIDASLVHCAMEADLSEATENAEGLAATGPAAALRLRYSFLSPQQRGELVTALDEFGLEAESERLANKGVQPITSSSSSYVSSNIASGLQGQIVKMAKDGNSEKAAMVLAKTLQQSVGAMTSMGGGRWDYDLIRLVYDVRRQQGDVLRKAISESKPTETSTAKDHLEFAYLNQLNGNIKEAAKYFESGIGKLPESSRYKYYGSAAITSGCLDPESSIQWIEKMRERDYGTLSGAIDSTMSPLDYVGDSGETIARLNLARAVTMWINRNPQAFSGKRSDFSWIENRVRGNVEMGLDGYASLLASGWYSKSQYGSQSEKNITERERIHQDLSLAMTQVPQLAHHSFTKHAALEVARQGDEAFHNPKLIELAQTSLKNYASKGMSGPANSTQRYNMFQSEQYPGWSPEEFLLWHSFQSGQKAAADFPELLKARDLDAKNAAEAFHGMLFGDASEFSSSLKKYLNQTRYIPPSHRYSYSGSQCLGVVGDVAERAFLVWQARRDELGDDFSITEFLQKEISRQKKTLQAEAALMAVKVIREQAAKDGWDSVAPFFLTLTKEWLGEEPNWVKFEKQVDNSRGYSREEYLDLGHRQFAGFLAALGWQEETVFPVLAFVSKHDLDDNSQISSTTLASRLDYDFFQRNGEFTTSVFQAGPFLRDTGHFDPVHTENDGKPVMLRLLQNAKRLNQEDRAEFTNLLKESDTFGGQLSLALWDGEKNKEDILKLLTESAAAIKKMSPSKTEGLAALIENIFPQGVPDSDAAKEAAPVLDLLGTARAKSLAEKAEEFLELEDLNKANLTSNSRLVNELGKQLNPLLQSGNFELMEKLYWHAVSLISNEQKKSGWGSYDSAWNAHGDFLYDLVDDTDGGGIERIAFYERLIRSDEEAKIAVSMTGRFSAFLKNHFDTQGGIQEMDKALTATFTKLLELSGEEASPTNLSICAEYFPLRLKPHETVKMIAWADKAASTSGPLQELARELSLSWRRGMTTNGAKPQLAQRGKVNEIDAWIPHTLTQLNNDNLPINLRIELAGRTNRAALENSSPELVLAAASAMAEGLNADAPFNGWRYVDVMKRFNELPVDDTWKEIAARIDEGWVHKNRNNHRDHDTGLPWDPWSNPVFLTLEFYGKLGDKEKMRRFLAEENASARIEGNARAFIALFYYGFPDEATNELDRSLSKVDIGTDFPTRNNDYKPYYTTAFHEKIDPFLETIDDEPKRFFAELLLRGTPDAPVEQREKNTSFPQRHKRIEEIAKKFLETDLSEASGIRESAVRQLAEFDNSAFLLREEISKMAAEFELQPVINKQNRDQIRYAMRLPASQATYDLKNGNLAQVRSFLNELKVASGSEYYGEKTLEYFSQRLANSFKNRHPYMQPKEIQAYADALHLLLGQPERKFVDHEQVRVVAVSKILADILAAEEPETSTSLVTNSFSTQRLKYLAEKLTNNNASQFWGHMTTGLKFNARNPALLVDDATRQARITAVLNHPLMTQVMEKETDLWEKLLRNKWVKDDEKDSEWAKTLLAALGKKPD